MDTVEMPNDIVIEVLEASGIKCKLGHLQHGERRIVPYDLGKRFVENGWAQHITHEGEELIKTGVRGSQDRKSKITPRNSVIR